MKRGGPPSWARRLLAWTLPPDGLGRTVLADLEEEFLERRDTGRGTPAFWYAREAIALSVHFWVRRLGRGVLQGNLRSGRNLRLAWRRLARAPGFAAVAILTIALGIAASVSVFSVVKTVVLEPLPYDEPSELVALFEWNTVRGVRDNVANPGNVRAWRDRSDAFRALTAASLGQPVVVSHEGAVSEAVTIYAHPDYFEVLGLEAEVGRTFVSEAGGTGGYEVVLSRRYWVERFRSDPGVVGRTLQVDGTPATVVGVLPDVYVVHGEGADLWISLDIFQGDQATSGRWLYPLGRLAQGATVEEARVELETIASALREEHPAFNAGWSVNLVPLQTQVVGEVEGALWLLLGAVGLLLAIACANVAALFLIRGAERAREMAVRQSLGASRTSLVAQLLVESLLVAGLGTALGVACGHLGTRLFATRMPDAFALPRVEQAGVDPGVLLLATALLFGTGLAFGLVPALRAARSDAGTRLREGGRGSSLRDGWLGSGLVVVEVALSVVLLAGAILLGRSFVTLASVDPGIDPGSVVVARVNLTGEAYEADGARTDFFQALTEELEHRPGVEAAGGNTFLPIEGWGAATSYWPGDRPPPPDEERAVADVRSVVGGYFEAMGLTLLQGRRLDAGDGPDVPRRVVVNRTLAERHWPGGTALGKPLVVHWTDDTPWEVVGVVEDVRMHGLDAEPRAAVYFSYAQAPSFSWMQVAVRGRAGVDGLADALRGAVTSLDGGVPVGEVELMRAVLSRSVARPRMTSLLMAVFAGAATLLAAVGLYGILSYTVSRRVREIGIRVALGATTTAILRMVAGRGVVLAGGGLVLGLMVTVAGGRAVAGLLFRVEPTDAASLALAGAAVAVVAVAASLLPAVRATRIQPLRALREE